MQFYSSDSSLSESEQSDDVSSPETVVLNKDDLDHDHLRDSWSSDKMPDLQELCFYKASVVVTNNVNVISPIDIYDNIDAFNDNDKFHKIYEVMKSINALQKRSATPTMYIETIAQIGAPWTPAKTKFGDNK